MATLSEVQGRAEQMRRKHQSTAARRAAIGVVIASIVVGCSTPTPEGSAPVPSSPATGNPVTAGPSASAEQSESNSTAPSPVASQDASPAVGWTLKPASGGLFTMAGQRCESTAVTDADATRISKAVMGIWEVTGESKMPDFPMDARLTITAESGTADLGAAGILDDGSEGEVDSMAHGPADWTQVQEGKVDGVSVRSTVGGTGEWRYFASGVVVFKLKATKPAVVKVNGKKQNFGNNFPLWEMTNMVWEPGGCEE